MRPHSGYVDPRLRLDRASLRSPRVQADGTVMYDAVLSRAGVFDYRNDDGSWRHEYRPQAEVFSADAMKSFEGMAATDYHPGPGIPVTAENRSALQVGYIVPGSLRRDGYELIGSIHVTDATMLKQIRKGRTAVSLGYFQDRVTESGVAVEDGKTYTHKQTNYKGNHVAFVDVARAGDDARIRVDSITIDHFEGDTVMDELKKALADLLAANTLIAQQKLRIDSLETENTTVKKTLATTEADRDTVKDKLEKSEKLRTDGEKNAMNSARARVNLENVATKILTVDGAAPSLDGKTDRQVREMVIVKLTGKEIPTGKSPEYIEARFDHLVEDSAEKGGNDAVNTRILAEGIRQDGEPRREGPALRADGTPDVDKMTAAEARKYNADRDANRWNQPKPQK